MTLSSSGLESWFPRNKCFYQDVHHYCLDLADEIATWSFWVPYATEPTGKGKSYSAGWGDWRWLPKENWVTAAQRGRRRLYLKCRVPVCIFTYSSKSWSKMNIFPLTVRAITSDGSDLLGKIDYPIILRKTSTILATGWRQRKYEMQYERRKL